VFLTENTALYGFQLSVHRYTLQTPDAQPVSSVSHAGILHRSRHASDRAVSPKANDHMKSTILTLVLGLLPGVGLLWGQPRQAPLYRVTVSSRSLSVFNYGGSNAIPTRIGFRGTALLPDAKGEAGISRIGNAVEIDAPFTRLGSPQRYGLNLLTYVLWAVTPNGRPQNLGEVPANHADRGKRRTAMRLQSFALVVTAEPDYSVTHPSGVIVLEKYALPDTRAAAEPVRANSALLPSQPIDYDLQAGQHRLNERGSKVSTKQHEELQALSQAVNAIQLASARGPDEYAPALMKKARALFEQAHSAKWPVQALPWSSRPPARPSRPQRTRASSARINMSR
jgi:hypothetical protein